MPVKHLVVDQVQQVGGAVAEDDRLAVFARRFGTFGGEPTMPTNPALIHAVVVRAREDFRDILFTEDIGFQHKRCSD